MDAVLELLCGEHRSSAAEGGNITSTRIYTYYGHTWRRITLHGSYAKRSSRTLLHKAKFAPSALSDRRTFPNICTVGERESCKSVRLRQARTFEAREGGAVLCGLSQHHDACIRS